MAYEVSNCCTWLLISSSMWATIEQSCHFYRFIHCSTLLGNWHHCLSDNHDTPHASIFFCDLTFSILWLMRISIVPAAQCDSSCPDSRWRMNERSVDLAKNLDSSVGGEQSRCCCAESGTCGYSSSLDLNNEMGGNWRPNASLVSEMHRRLASPSTSSQVSLSECCSLHIHRTLHVTIIFLIASSSTIFIWAEVIAYPRFTTGFNSYFISIT